MLGSGPAAAQPDSLAPAAVAESFFRAAAAGRWRDAARHVDLVAFDAMRRERVGAIRSALRRPPITVEQYMEADPQMPRAVAEYHVKQIHEAMGRMSNPLAHDFADVPNVDSLATLSPLDAAARWLEAQDERYQYRMAIAAARPGRGCEGVPVTSDTLAAPPPRPVLGAVVRDSVAYVVHGEPKRSSLADSSLASPEVLWEEPPAVLVLRRRRGLWLVDPRQGWRLLGGPMGIAVFSQCSRSR